MSPITAERLGDDLVIRGALRGVPEFVTPNAAASFVPVDAATIYRAIHDGKLEATEVSPPNAKRARYVIRAVDALLMWGTRTAASYSPKRELV